MKISEYMKTHICIPSDVVCSGTSLSPVQYLLMWSILTHLFRRYNKNRSTSNRLKPQACFLKGNGKKEGDIGGKAGKCKKTQRHRNPQREHRCLGNIFPLASEEAVIHTESGQDADQKDRDIQNEEIPSDDPGIGIEQRDCHSHGNDRHKETPVEERDDLRPAFYIFNYRNKQNRKEDQLQMFPDRFIDRTEEGGEGSTPR